jgi:glycine hydroxymethyltransferase
MISKLFLFNKNNIKNLKTIATNLSRNISTNLVNTPIYKSDPELFKIIEDEKKRQKESLVLIASENFTSLPVMEALGSVMQNKYSEGLPNARYYGGNENIDKSELLCQKRALEAFNLNPEYWGVNVQPHSGSPANFQVYNALIGPNGRIMGLDLSHGGHLTHGFFTPKKKISASSIYFESQSYKINEETFLIDYEKLEESAKIFKPNIIIAGTSAYPRAIDYKQFRSICNETNSYLLADISHIAGLISAGLHPNPFEYADVVTTTTHKSLRGPRGAMIFYRKMGDIENKINFSVFPSLQGGPHNHTIAALATALKQANTEEFVEYQKQVIKNADIFGKELIKRGYKLIANGTDTHLLLIDLTNKGIDGARVEKIMELCKISVNKNTIPGDKSAMIPSGIRIGTLALTTRGFKEEDFIKVTEYFDEAVKITSSIQNKIKTKKIKDFKNYITSEEFNNQEILNLKNKVIEFASSFETIG